jgi:arabinose-5-phosphate isomerase
MPLDLTSDELTAIAAEVLEIESRAVDSLRERLNVDFGAACELCVDTPGRIVVTGMGKSGHIGHKIAATLASTGTPAFFMHPGEASHGDLGMITGQDVLLAVSYSGETDEVLTILPLVKRMGAKMISMTGNPKSTLARAADVHLDVSVSEEACPLNLAPTASTTATLAMGDALAVALLKIRGFTAEDFAMSHPSGSLGKRLLLRVEDVMRTGKDVPKVTPDVLLQDGLIEISQKGLGMTAIADADDVILGIFTDGDLRRALDSRVDINTTPMSQLMTRGGKHVHPGMLAAEALRVMEENQISSLVVLGEQGDLAGILHLMHLLHAGLA